MSQRRTPWLDPAVVMTEVACVALALVACAPFLVGRCVYESDILPYGLPQLTRLQEEVLAGRLRVWDLGIFAGYHALAGGPTGSLYPLNWLLLAAFPVVTAFQVGVVLHLWMLGRGALGLVRELGGSRKAGLLAAAPLVLGGATVSHLIHVSVVVGLGWLTPLLWLAARLGRRPGGVPALLLAGAFAISLLQSHPQWVAYQTLGVLITSACVAPRGELRRALTWTVAALAGAGLLAAGLLLPTVNYHGLFPRPQPGGAWTFTSSEGLVPVDLPAILLGAPRDETAEVVFFGALCWSLALVRIALGRLDPLARVGVGLAAVGLFLSLGQLNPVYPLLAGLPPLSWFRYPGRAAILLQVGLALLAAGGVDRLPRATPKARNRLLGVGAGLLSAAGLVRLAIGDAGPTPSLLLAPAVLILIARAVGTSDRRWITAALALGLIELALACQAINPTVPVATITESPPLAQVVAASDNPRTVDLAEHQGVEWVPAMRRLRRNSGVRFGVRYLTGYESAPPLGQEEWTRQLNTLRADPHRLVPRCSELSVRWIVSDVELTHPGLRERGRDAGAVLYENLTARPLVYAIGSSAHARLEVQTPTRLQAELTLRAPGRVVVAYAWYPGWTAWRDGEELPIELHEQVFMAIDLPRGPQQIELRFEDPLLDLGLRVQGGAWLVWLVLLLRAFRRRRRPDTASALATQ